MDKNEFLSRICESAGLDYVHEHYGLSAGTKVGLDVGGFELWIKIRQAAIDLLMSITGKIDTATYEMIKAAMNEALQMAWAKIDFPGPDYPWEAMLTWLANWSLDRAYALIVSGS